MCDDRTVEESASYLSGLTRRQLGAAALGVAAWSALPNAGASVPLVSSEVGVTTPDGEADAYFVHPAEGKHAAVIVWPDILGLRPAFRQMAQRLAGAGYAVLVVNPYYRQMAAPVVQPGESFQDQATRDKVLPLARSLSQQTNRRDAQALVDFLDQQAAVDRARPMGTIGYCMGGPMTLITAATIPERIGAVGSFHGGRLVTAGEDSPHLLIPNMRAAFLIAIAENDDAQEPQTKDVLRKHFAAAGLSAEVEVYLGALHGWCPPDSRVYNHDQAERAWSRLLALFDGALSTAAV